MIASRSRRRSSGGVRLTAVAAALLAGAVAVGAASGCSAGQNAQTASQVPAIPGVNANIGPGGMIALRDVVVQYRGPGGYAAGDSAALVVRIFNGLDTSVTLTGVTADGKAGGVKLVTGAQPSPATAAPASPTAPASPAPTSPAPTSPAPTSPAPTAPPAESPSPTAPAPGGGRISVEIAPSSYALLVPGQGPYLQLTGLTEALLPGQSVPVTFTFSDGSRVTLSVPMGVPTAPAPRASQVIEPGE